MIANRFKSMGWVMTGGVAAMALYLITSQVAAERTELERVEGNILSTKKDIRQLETELGTRANLRQLERWNGEVLALSAPDADQFMSGEMALASLDRSGIRPGPRYAPTALVTAMVNIPSETSNAVPQTKPASSQSVAIAPLDNATVFPPTSQPNSAPGKPTSAAKIKTTKAQSTALTSGPKTKAKDRKLAQLESRLLDDRLMGELTSRAASEGRREGRKAQ